jgi:protein gp37
MSGKSAIEWTEATWNPVTGCDQISPGCDHCYALTLAGRLKAMGQPRYQKDGDPRTSGPGFGLTLHEDKIGEPLRWRKPRVVFVNSMSDLFHKSVPVDFIGRVFNVMGQASQHTFQVLTKRPKRMSRVLTAYYDTLGIEPYENVWLGTSIESADYNWRVDHLLAAPANVHFISAEPLLGPLTGIDLTDVDWLIVGGESGSDARPMREEWVRELRDLCIDQQTAFFFKQWGGRTPKSGGRTFDGQTWDGYPVAVEIVA